MVSEHISVAGVSFDRHLRIMTLTIPNENKAFSVIHTEDFLTSYYSPSTEGIKFEDKDKCIVTADSMYINIGGHKGLKDRSHLIVKTKLVDKDKNTVGFKVDVYLKKILGGNADIVHGTVTLDRWGVLKSLVKSVEYDNIDKNELRSADNLHEELVNPSDIGTFIW